MMRPKATILQETGELRMLQPGCPQAAITPRADLNRQVVEEAAHRVGHGTVISKNSASFQVDSRYLDTFHLHFTAMHQFHYSGQKLYCESVDLAAVAQLHGTPTYVYSAKTIEDNYRRLTASLSGLDVQLCFAMKANSNLAILRLFSNLGGAFDVVSAGELRRALTAGIPASRIVFSGVGKTVADLRLAVSEGIEQINVESREELGVLSAVAQAAGRVVDLVVRVNPDVDAETHAKITTGKSDNKFGIPLKAAAAAYEAAAKYPNIEIKGVQMHIGSQLTSAAPFVEAVKKVVPFVEELKKLYGITYFSVGGGIGIVYQDALASGDAAWWSSKPEGERPLTPEAYGAALTPLLAPLGLKILLEPGRFLVGNAGVLLSRVEYLKRGSNKNFLVLDAAMNDLVRPAMYEAYHEVVPLLRDSSRPALQADIVGPICESGDCFAKDRTLQTLGEGELVAFMSAGAYGYTMASRYNTRPAAAEVLVSGSRFELVNARESFDAMLAGEKIPGFLKT